MIAPGNFIPTVCSAIARFQRCPPNQQQETCLLAPADTPLMIVAGPGSGKTTVLVLRALRLVFVNGLMPENIIVTTFTRKAAKEIRSRLIEWGLSILDYLQCNPPTSVSGFTQWLDDIDINRFITGTLDSICEEKLTTCRDLSDPPPVLVEGFVGNALLAREGLFPSGALNNSALNNYLALFTRDGKPPRNFGETISVCRIVVDRLIQDQVNIEAYASGAPNTQGRQCVVNSLQAYRNYMTQGNRMDFAGLEEVFLNRLMQGQLQRFTSTIRAILVDEYQDTNPLQENIYFELVKQTTSSFSVVGDDDQSLYRFRGATVELFCQFPSRLRTSVPTIPVINVKYLVDNYRSTPEIVTFFNNYISCDPNFAAARVQPPKPLINAQLPTNQIPVLGMFRRDAVTLATDLSSFLYDIFRGQGRIITINGQNIQIIRHADRGDFGDAVLLAHTVNEFGPRFGNNPPRARLPYLLRQELAQRGVEVFNPRGQALRDILQVKRLLGLILECIDAPTISSPYGVQQKVARMRRDALFYLCEWRKAARDFIASNPSPTSPHTIGQFVQDWQTRRNPNPGANWPEEWPILELCYKLITWIAYFQEDPEGQVYLETISRCIAQAATFSPYRSTIISGQGIHDDKSVLKTILDIFVPLAENALEVDEEIMPHIPHNRLPIMTIHQAKGLEFPLVIIDIASDFKTNNKQHKFRRFPETPSATQILEDDQAPYSNIGHLRTSRTALARAFDDLTRLYYVAYSRAQSLLMLVGIDKCLKYNTLIKHIATGWRYNGTWSWKVPVQGKAPPIVNNHPLELI